MRQPQVERIKVGERSSGVDGGAWIYGAERGGVSHQRHPRRHQEGEDLTDL